MLKANADSRWKQPSTDPTKMLEDAFFKQTLSFAEAVCV
jgi:hypothetical protein